MEQRASEIILQYYWQQYGGSRLWKGSQGELIQIEYPGDWNVYDGPDFQMASWYCDGHFNQGPVEIHIRASDWEAHGHLFQPRYQEVGLHIVAENDTTKIYAPHTICMKENGIGVWQMIRDIQAKNIRPEELFNWERKRERFEKWRQEWGSYHAHWIGLSRAMGCHIHGDELEQWACRVPWSDPFFKASSLQEIWSYMLRLGGFFEGIQHPDTHTEYLMSVSLLPSLYPIIHWKRKSRPNNRVELRIIQIGKLFYLYHNQDILEWSLDKWHRSLRELEVPAYWAYHYSLSKPMKMVSTRISETTAKNIVLNAFGHMSVE
jgi:hypothetical protein